MSKGKAFSFIFCDAENEFARAISVLQRSKHLILDCEGKELGTVGGAVSLICVGSERAEDIFVFDVITLRQKRVDLGPLLRLLGSDDVLKITWDGRMDFMEMWETYGIELGGTLDLQIAEVMSRGRMRRETERQRMDRLAARFFGFQTVRSCPELYRGIHIVLGMQTCLKENKLGDGVEKDPEVVAMHRTNGSALWMERPLSEKLLRYAATDIYLISLLYEDFRRRSWITPRIERDLLSQSQRYISMYKEGGRLDPENVFQKGPLIALGELTAQYDQKVHQCAGCGRLKPLSCFETRMSGSAKMRMPRCRICVVLAMKRNLAANEDWMVVFDD